MNRADSGDRIGLGLSWNPGALAVHYARRHLLSYVFEPDAPTDESPRPYVHPLHTLSGVLVTAYRPADHRWHHGLSFALANVSGHNFWGGPTYVRGAGYTGLTNHGRVVHRSWDEVRGTATDVDLTESLDWKTGSGEVLLREVRRIVVSVPDISARVWYLELDFTLANVTTRPLEIRSPGTEGREGAGYGGLFWRASDAFMSAATLADGGFPADYEMAGIRSPWLAVVQRSARSGAATVAFVDRGAHPERCTWFVRRSPYRGVNPAVAFTEPVLVQPARSAIWSYAMAIGDSPWDRALVRQWLTTR